MGSVRVADFVDVIEVVNRDNVDRSARKADGENVDILFFSMIESVKVLSSS